MVTDRCPADGKYIISFLPDHNDKENNVTGKVPTASAEKGMSTGREINGGNNIPPSEKESGEKTSFKSGVNGNILLMDDEAFIRETVGAMLKHLGYNVYKAADGAEAIKTLEEEMIKGVKFKAIILDLTIPNKMGGRETISIIRKMGIDIPAFAASGYSDDPVISRPREYGFTDSLRKPFGMQDLSELFKNYLPGDIR